MNFYQNIIEGIRFAFQALIVNRMRTILSLLGITIGIFSIISVLSVVDSLERNIRDSFSGLGSDVVYVQKWAWGGGGEYPWWKYFQRPEPTYEEMEKLETRLTHAQNLAFMMSLSANINYRNNTVDAVSMAAVSHDYAAIWPMNIAEGRYFSPLESQTGTPLIILGYEVAEGLFGGMNPLGKDIRILGRKVRVIGILEREGSKLIGQSHDEMVLLPVNFVRRIVNERNVNGAAIMVQAYPGESLDQLKDEITGKMRGLRHLRPKAEDDFSINEMSMLNQGLDQLFGIIGLAGWVIGGFAILAGGFGIANIMFVSVSERTDQIGVQKALGARRRFILTQFLTESTALSMIGGIIGLILVAIVLGVVSQLIAFNIFLSTGNVITGLLISAVIGLVSGIIPALVASRMDPVEAIRSAG